ncbi:Bax inhibitor-1/YccA family protein [Candidatus Cyanaurora vandensis]|uniref:Bax inhibitor-1/YccA family protein n=1 Tax=Candidatus Cyanaurora vandensis TaxID=2714958 RepID=UPI002579E29E|nr:Bax inhibitor-1/YccA family protein [Candidatus Cyanaurora vandensis]
MYDLRDRTTFDNNLQQRVNNLPTAFAGMGVALGLTGAVSWWAATNIPGIGGWFWPLLIVQFGLLFAISSVRSWAREAEGLSLVLLFVYAGITGLVLAPVANLYLASSVGQEIVFKALGSAAAAFGAAAIYGWTTKRDLSNWGSILFMAVIGLFISSLLNVFFFQSTWTQLFISGASVLIFTAFTAYDLNMAKENRFNQTAGQIALGLYLNFLNLFLAFLQIFGLGGRDD